MNIYIDLPRITGTEINYYLVCKKKLWLFSRQLTMEQNSQKVEIGKTIHEDSFSREKKEVLIDDTIMIDFTGKQLTIHETKSTNAMDRAARYQLLYYIYYLEKKGIKGVKGIVHYYKNRSTEEIQLTDIDRNNLDAIIKDIEEIKASALIPEVQKTKLCDKCSYFELCYC